MIHMIHNTPILLGGEYVLGEPGSDCEAPTFNRKGQIANLVPLVPKGSAFPLLVSD